MYRRLEQEKDAKWIRVQAEHRLDSPAVVEPIPPPVDLDAADVEEQPASKKPRRAEQFDDEDLADNNYSDSELPDIIEDDDDDDEPIREHDAKRSRVNEDDPPMPDHLLPSDDEDVDYLIVKALVDAGVDEKRARAQTKIFTHNDETSFMEIYGRGGITIEANGPRRSLNAKGLEALDIRTLKT